MRAGRAAREGSVVSWLKRKWEAVLVEIVVFIELVKIVGELVTGLFLNKGDDDPQKPLDTEPSDR